MLEAANLHFAYRRETPVLKGVSLQLAPGTFTAVLGRNGSGKSTLLSLLTAARTPSQGEVFLDGQPIAALDGQRRAQKIAFVAQHSHGNGLTVFDAVLLGRRPFMDGAPSVKDKEITAQVLQDLNIESFALRPLNELSGGEYQTVMLARAFAQNTETLLLDEPTNNLDPANQHQVMSLVRNRVDKENVAALAVMHDLNLALRHCDRFLFLKNGEVDAYGGIEVVTAQEIRTIYGVDMDVISHKGRLVAV